MALNSASQTKLFLKNETDFSIQLYSEQIKAKKDGVSG
jgi:hypothetical protein